VRRAAPAFSGVASQRAEGLEHWGAAPREAAPEIARFVVRRIATGDASQPVFFEHSFGTAISFAGTRQPSC
jgi:hypothetical protein